jgi:bifunctional enzyme CysN/CysC
MSTAATGVTVWLTGLSGAGKTTTARQVINDLKSLDVSAILLDGDELRDGVSEGLGFTAEGRAEAVRRAGEIALIAAQQGLVAIVSMVSPHEAPRQLVRQRHEDAGIAFIEVHVATPLDVCEQRDPKDLYRRARSGQESSLTGVQQAYEMPSDPELRLSTSTLSPSEASQLILEKIGLSLPA